MISMLMLASSILTGCPILPLFYLNIVNNLVTSCGILFSKLTEQTITQWVWSSQGASHFQPCTTSKPGLVSHFQSMSFNLYHYNIHFRTNTLSLVHIYLSIYRTNTSLSHLLWIKQYYYRSSTRMALALNNPWRLICHKKEKTKPDFCALKVNLVLFTNPSARAGYDTRSIFKRSLTGFNSEFSFS